MYKILVVEDDEVIARTVCAHLCKWGFETEASEDFRDVLGTFVRFAPQLVLLDLSLPFYNGFHWCAEIRRLSKVPVVFLSSAADHLNIVTAMDMGGDDFIAKPFALDVLTAKVQALLRRAYAYHGTARLLECGGAVLNVDEAALVYGGRQVELTRNELRILQLLFEQAGKTVSRDAMMLKLWQSDSFIDDNTLTVNMGRLRRKLATIGADGLIVTRKGIGYSVG